MASDFVIKFTAEVVKIQTLADGGIRLTFDISENLTDIAAQLMECKNRGGLLEVAAVAVKAKHGRKSKKVEPADNFGATY